MHLLWFLLNVEYLSADIQFELLNLHSPANIWKGNIAFSHFLILPKIKIPIHTQFRVLLMLTNFDKSSCWFPLWMAKGQVIVKWILAQD